jgi:hypothetical protein
MKRDKRAAWFFRCVTAGLVLIAAAVLAAGCGNNPGASRAVKLTEDEQLALVRQAGFLTENYVDGALDQNILDGAASGSDAEITGFILTISRYMDEPGHPYHDFVSVTPDRVYVFPAEGVRQIAYEVFGVQDWGFGSDIAFNEARQQYESGLEFGIGHNYSCKDLETAVSTSTGTVKVSFSLERTVGEGEALGRCRISFEIHSEDDRVFLRYKGIEAVE